MQIYGLSLCTKTCCPCALVSFPDISRSEIASERNYSRADHVSNNTKVTWRNVFENGQKDKDDWLSLGRAGPAPVRREMAGDPANVKESA